MGEVPADLVAFLTDHRDAREYRRGLAVKLAYQGYTYETIATILDVSLGFISQAKTAYETAGSAGLQLKYRGAVPKLTDEERTTVIAWLKVQNEWSVDRLRTHLEATYGVVYASNQSYYALLAAADITYKKAQTANPKRDAEQVAAKKKLFTTS